MGGSAFGQFFVIEVLDLLDLLVFLETSLKLLSDTFILTIAIGGPFNVGVLAESVQWARKDLLEPGKEAELRVYCRNIRGAKGERGQVQI